MAMEASSKKILMVYFFVPLLAFYQG